MKSKWIAVAGRKGGVGKSALALSLAARFARAGKRVILVDMDPQASLSVVLGADTSGKMLAAMLSGDGREEALFERDGIMLVPGGPDVAKVANPVPLRTVSGSMDADILILDCPPGHTSLDLLAIEAADVVLACCDAHRMATAGAARVVGAATACVPTPRCAGVIGRLDFRRTLDREGPHALKKALKVPILVVRQDAALASNLNSGVLPPETGPAAEDVGRISRWITKETR